jgi:RNA-dependent RNA polymerase
MKMLLLGVPYSVFEKYQDMIVEHTKASSQLLQSAATLLEAYGLGTSFHLPSIMISLDKLGISSLNDDFYEMLMQYSINHVLRELKHHARIPIPGAWTLVGVADAHSFLGPEEIFACVKEPYGRAMYLQGPILISRSPTIHPGDVRIVHAIGEPPKGSCFDKEPLKNTVVFSVKGMSSHCMDYKCLDRIFGNCIYR